MLTSLIQDQYETFSKPWHPRHGLNVINRIKKYVTESTGHQFSTKKLTIDLLRKTYLHRLQKMGFQDAQLEQAKINKANLFQDMKIGTFLICRKNETVGFKTCFSKFKPKTNDRLYSNTRF